MFLHEEMNKDNLILNALFHLGREEGGAISVGDLLVGIILWLQELCLINAESAKQNMDKDLFTSCEPAQFCWR